MWYQGQQQQQYGQQAQVGMQAYTQQAQLQQQQALGQQQMGMDQYGQQTGYGHQQAASNMAYGQQAQQSSFTQAGQQQGSAQASTAVPGFRDPYAASAGQQTVAAATPATGGSTIQFDQYGQPYTVTKDTFTAPSANPYAAYAQQQQQQQQQQEAQRKAMLEQQQKQLEAQREAQRQDQLKKQQVCHAICPTAACSSEETPKSGVWYLRARLPLSSHCHSGVSFGFRGDGGLCGRFSCLEC